MALIGTKTVTEEYTVSMLLDQIRSGVILDNYSLQRPAEQHSKSYKDAFISTVIKNEDFDSLKVCEQKRDNSVVMWLIDGLQRVSEIQDYRNGAFKLGRIIEYPIVEYRVAKIDEDGEIIKDSDGIPQYETQECDLRGKSYDDLPSELQKQFDFCSLVVVKHLDCTDAEIAYHMRRYNKQVPLNSSQTAMTYADKCAAQIKSVAENRFFLDCGHFTANERKKGGIDRVILESVMSTFHLNNWKKQAIQMGEYANENVTDKEIEKINEYFTRLYVIAEGKYEDIFNSKNTFIFIPVFDEFTKLGLDDSAFGTFLDAFKNTLHGDKYDGVSYDELAECRATKDKSRIIEKITHLKNLLYQYFGENFDKGFVTKLHGVTIEEFISEVIGVSKQDVTEDMDFYNSCLDDAMDRVIPFDSKLREPENRFSLLAATAYTIVNDMDIESLLSLYIKDHESYLPDQRRNYEQMIDNFNHFTEQKIA